MLNDEGIACNISHVLVALKNAKIDRVVRVSHRTNAFAHPHLLSWDVACLHESVIILY